MREHYSQILDELRHSNKLRTLPNSQSAPLSTIFNSNDYLGLSKHPVVMQAAVDAIQKEGIGSTGSRVLSGNHSGVHQLESSFASYIGYDRVIVFNSGYQMNVGSIAALYGKQDLIIADKYSHASLIDGIRLSGASFKRYAHLDMNHLKRLLDTYRQQFKRCLIVTESIFSMDGDCAPLSEIQAFADHYEAELMVDEAHALGVMGPDGKGLCALESIQPTYLLGTFGKAFGSAGAFMATDSIRASYLINTCRSFIYSTALPVPVTASIHAAMQLMPSLHDKRQRLQELSNYCLEKSRKSHVSMVGYTHIVSVIIPGNTQVLVKQKQLHDQHIIVSAIRHPTVPKGKERLRISLTALHTHTDIDQLFYAF